MHPVLFTIGRFHIYTYGVFVALSILVGSSLFVREGKRSGLDPSALGDIVIYAVVFGVIAARMFYVVLNLDEFRLSFMDILFIWKGGFVFRGAILGGVFGAYVGSRRKGISFVTTVDTAAPFIPLSHAIGRLGCFSAGCCYGKVCHLSWAITVKNPMSLSPLGVSLHPVQLYSSFMNTLIFLFLYFFFKKKKKFPGELILEYLALYGVGRFVVEFYRGDPRPMVFKWLSFNQLFAGICAIFSFALIIALRSRRS